MTPTLSVDAVHEREIVVVVEPVTVRPVGVESLVASAHAAVEVVSEVLLDLLPAASKASTASV